MAYSYEESNREMERCEKVNKVYLKKMKSEFQENNFTAVLALDKIRELEIQVGDDE